MAPDPVADGYERLYAGHREGAYRRFAALHEADPASLPNWFGLLFAQMAYLEIEPGLVPGFEKSVAAFLQHAEQRYTRSRSDAEALFYLAQGYLLRSTFRIEHGKGMIGAARDAAKSKAYSDSYLDQHPEHGDAYLALGLYNYYVDIAPNFVKVLRVLLFLPSGNRARGLEQIERAAREGSLFAPLAESALADIYGTLEGRLGEAIAIGERLVRRFPANAEMRTELAVRYLHPTVEAFDRAAEQYEAVIRQSGDSSPEHLHARYRALLGLAQLRRNQWRLEEANAILTPAIDQRISTPDWVLPRFLLQRANYRMLLDDAAAIEDARRVVNDRSMTAFHRQAARQITNIEARRRGDEARIYAALVPGNRLMSENRWHEAAAVYDKVAATNPHNWQVKYRRAYLEFARGRVDLASPAFHEIALAREPMPAWLKAAALLNLGWTQDLAGRRDEALKTYKRVVDNYENEASAGAARVGLIAPYRRFTGDREPGTGNRHPPGQ